MRELTGFKGSGLLLHKGGEIPVTYKITVYGDSVFSPRGRPNRRRFRPSNGARPSHAVWIATETVHGSGSRDCHHGWDGAFHRCREHAPSILLSRNPDMPGYAQALCSEQVVEESRPDCFRRLATAATLIFHALAVF